MLRVYYIVLLVPGDFAVLLRAGMSIRSAIVYNVVSSVLCFFGMFVGIGLGNIHEAAEWIFACVAGMFIYIALVDMVRTTSCLCVLVISVVVIVIIVIVIVIIVDLRVRGGHVHLHRPRRHGENYFLSVCVSN